MELTEEGHGWRAGRRVCETTGKVQITRVNCRLVGSMHCLVDSQTEALCQLGRLAHELDGREIMAANSGR